MQKNNESIMYPGAYGNKIDDAIEFEDFSSNRSLGSSSPKYKSRWSTYLGSNSCDKKKYKALRPKKALIIILYLKPTKDFKFDSNKVIRIKPIK
jgi:hypothetical protein